MNCRAGRRITEKQRDVAEHEAKPCVRAGREIVGQPACNVAVDRLITTCASAKCTPSTVEL